MKSMWAEPGLVRKKSSFDPEMREIQVPALRRKKFKFSLWDGENSSFVLPSDLFFWFLTVAKLIQVISVELMISQRLCSKNFSFFSQDEKYVGWTRLSIGDLDCAHEASVPAAISNIGNNDSYVLNWASDCPISSQNDREIRSVAKALELIILQDLCSKNSNFFFKTERMWAESVLVPSLGGW